MQAIFSLLRAMRAEDLCAGGPRKYSKTGGFRRPLASADSNVLHLILKQIDVPSDTQREELVDPFGVLDTDSGGFPTIFFRALSGNVSRVPSSSLGSAVECLQSEAPTLVSVKPEAPTIYHLEGLPVPEPSTDTDIRHGQCEPDNMDDDDSDDLQALEDRLVVHYTQYTKAESRGERSAVVMRNATMH